LHCGQRIHRPSGTPRFGRVILAMEVFTLRRPRPRPGPQFRSRHDTNSSYHNYLQWQRQEGFAGCPTGIDWQFWIVATKWV